MKVKKISENIVEVDGQRFIKEDSKGWLDVPELGISVELEVHDKNKSWKELGLDNRENELLTAEQCIFLANTPKYAKALKMDGSSTKDDFFIKQYFELNKKNGYVARFYADSDWVNLGSYYNSDDSDSTLGVRVKWKVKQ